MHVNNGSLGAVQMYKDCFGIAVLYSFHTPALKLYSKFIKKVINFLLGFLNKGCMAD
jgi:hypothetical protein